MRHDSMLTTHQVSHCHFYWFTNQVLNKHGVHKTLLYLEQVLMVLWLLPAAALGDLCVYDRATLCEVVQLVLEQRTIQR